MPKISVIIPVYNTEKYLRKCLDSVVNQTLEDIEIICVNDGSTDSSLKILEEYVQKDNRVRVISQENQGVSIARNTGIKTSTADFIMFLDSDDTIEFNTLELSFAKITKTNADICCFGLNEITKDFRKPRDWGESKYLREYENKELDIEAKKAFIINACGKLFRRDFLLKNNILFGPNIKMGEDAIFNLCCLFNNPKYTILNAYLYNYLMDREDSATNCLKNAVKYDIEAHKYFIQTELFKNAPEYLKIIAIEKFIGETGYFYSKAPEYKFRFFIQISMFYVYLYKTLSPSLLVQVQGMNKINPFKIILKSVFSIGNSSDKRHKIITILGINIKIKRKSHE